MLIGMAGTQNRLARFSGTLNLTGAPGHSLPTPPPISHWKLENTKSIIALRDLIPTLRRRAVKG